MITKKDYLIGAGAGVLTGILLLVIFSFLNVSFRFDRAVALLGIPILWAGGVWLGGVLSKFIPFAAQFGKYAAAGFLSAAIDFSVLNYVSYITGITAGVVIGWVNVPGFIFAVINGYLWNKLWVFKNYGDHLFSDFPKFLLVTVIGLFINSGLIIAFTTYLPMYIDIAAFTTSSLWLNISKFLANGVVLIWNFTGYKFIVFSAKGGSASGGKKL